MQYQIVICQDIYVHKALKELEQKVQKLCQEGWTPQGGISVAVKNYDWCFACQAMVK